MSTQTETKARQEAPLAAVIFGALALVTAFVASTPGFPMILGGVGAIAAIVEFARAQRDGRRVSPLAIVGIIAALAGMVVSFLMTSV